MSTTRTASIRARGGSALISRGGSPDCTQRQNFFSAETRTLKYSGSRGTVISTHLPPPVIIDSTEDRRLVTHMLCCSWGMYFSAAASSEKDHGSMNLASKTASSPSTIPSSVARHPGDQPMPDVALHIAHPPAGCCARTRRD